MVAFQNRLFYIKVRVLRGDLFPDSPDQRALPEPEERLLKTSDQSAPSSADSYRLDSDPA